MNPVAWTLIRNPPVISTASPAYTRLEASVARNEWIRSRVIATPFTRPSAAPASGAAIRPSTGLFRCSATQAATTFATLKIAPVDRSKPPQMTTSVPATAMIASGAFWLRMFSRFVSVRNDDVETLSTTNSATSMIRTA